MTMEVRRVVQFCSGLVDLVVCIGHHGGGGHRFTLATVTESRTLARLSATRPARCYGRHPTLRRSRAPAVPGCSKNRRLDTARGALGIHSDSDTEF